MMRSLDLLTTAGIPLRVVHLDAGEPGYLRHARDDAHAVVQFFDARHRSDDCPAGQYLGVSSRAVDLLTVAPDAELVLTGDGGPWRIDAATMTLIRTWIGQAEPGRGFHHPHTLLAALSGDLMAIDVAELHPGDVVFAGGHLVRRVIGVPVRARHGRDVIYRYPVVRLTFPDGAPGDGPDRYSLFQAREGTAMLILRPARRGTADTPTPDVTLTILADPHDDVGD
jgi:hypothetical protein